MSVAAAQFESVATRDRDLPHATKLRYAYIVAIYRRTSHRDYPNLAGYVGNLAAEAEALRCLFFGERRWWRLPAFARFVQSGEAAWLIKKAEAAVLES